MTTTDLGIVPAPKPGPVIPSPAVRGAGVNQDSVEARSRIVAMLLPHSKDVIQSVDELLDIAGWILTGEDDSDDD